MLVKIKEVTLEPLKPLKPSFHIFLRGGNTISVRPLLPFVGCNDSVGSSEHSWSAMEAGFLVQGGSFVFVFTRFSAALTAGGRLVFSLFFPTWLKHTEHVS